MDASPISINDSHAGLPPRAISIGRRYGLAIAVSCAAVVAQRILGARLGRDLSLLVPFLAIAAAAAFGGAGPGLLATLTCCGAIWAALPGQRIMSPQSIGLLAVQGIFVSILGEGLFSIRRRARRGDLVRRKLEKQILEIGEDERRRIGHDLHDGLGQHLTGISLLSESMSQQMAVGVMPPPAQAETVTRLVSEAVGWTRDLARNLWPATLERDGFVAAMEELASTAGSLLRIRCTWHHDDSPLVLEPQRAIHLYRIVQEALNNSVKHGKATTASITLTSKGGEMTLIVLDNGGGLSAKTRINPGLGLRIMSYRANLIGAVLQVERAAPEGGTRVVCRCSVVERANDQAR